MYEVGVATLSGLPMSGIVCFFCFVFFIRSCKGWLSSREQAMARMSGEGCLTYGHLLEQLAEII